MHELDSFKRYIKTNKQTNLNKHNFSSFLPNYHSIGFQFSYKFLYRKVFTINENIPRLTI